MKKLVLGSSLGLLVAGACYILIYLAFDRTSEFRTQAKLGQPIVQAIDEYHKQIGNYPTSLADLTPKYLTTLPDIGWYYQIITNGSTISYHLMYYMGKGGVEYVPSDWIGNDEGHKTVILINR